MGLVADLTWFTSGMYVAFQVSGSERAAGICAGLWALLTLVRIAGWLWRAYRRGRFCAGP